MAARLVNRENRRFQEAWTASNFFTLSTYSTRPMHLLCSGAFGVDFSYDVDTSAGLAKVAKELLKHGVTSFCPTLVTSPSHIYHKVLPMINKTAGGVTGAGILGVHLEGPFISKEKKGAHPEQCILPLDGADQAMEEVYGEGFEEHTAIITLAPELPGALDEIQRLTEKGVVCSIGHSEATLKDGERAVRAGAKFITHLFNAMLPFHHRDPGLVGLLTSWKLPKNCHVFYGLIADGIHTHPATMRIAHRTNPSGLVLVSDAIGAAGLAAGVHNLGQQSIEVRDKKAFVTGTNTLCGRCVRTFYEATECTLVEALEAATLHPAQLLGITERKGTLAFGSDADLLVLDDGLTVLKTFIAGECVWNRSHDQ